jgi:glycerol-1-phosphate dehydrogenase [NAD(P)+]
VTLPPPARLIETIAAGRFRLPATGQPFAAPVRQVVIAPTLDGQEAELVRAQGLAGRLGVICDEVTHDVLGRRVAGALHAADGIVLRSPRASDAEAAALQERCRHAEGLITVGSGTLTDLGKQVAARTGRPLVAFATAPSMNGYVTATASITCAGQKRTLPAVAPRAVFCDLAVLAAAPARLIRAGIGDALCRTTAQVDWLLAHLLLGQPYSATPFALQAAAEGQILRQAAAAAGGEPAAVRALTELLILGGFGMLIAGSSASASQGEHLISHYIDSFARPHPGSLHGEQVAVATLTMAALQAEILDLPEPPRLARVAVDSAALAARHGPLADAAAQALARKALPVDELNERLARDWPALRARLAAAALPPERLRTLFAAAGVPATPAAISLDPAFYRSAVRHARELRDRFTMLDFAAHAGRLDAFAERAA